MTDAFVAGIFAGLGIAIPVGAIAVLIIEAAVRHGFRVGWAAGAGAATADGSYALLAALFGTVIADLLAPWQTPLRLLAVAVLVVIAVRGLLALRNGRTGARDEDPPTMRRAYLVVTGLTIINPMTVAYFAALILGLPGIADDPASKIAFAAAAFLASLAWQTVDRRVRRPAPPPCRRPPAHRDVAPRQRHRARLRRPHRPRRPRLSTKENRP